MRCGTSLVIGSLISKRDLFYCLQLREQDSIVLLNRQGENEAMNGR